MTDSFLNIAVEKGLVMRKEMEETTTQEIDDLRDDALFSV